MTTELLDNRYCSVKLQWEVIDLWNIFLNLLSILVLHLELNCSQFEFWIFFLYSNILLLRFYLFHWDQVQSHFSILIKIVMKNVLHHMHFMTIFTNFLYAIPMANVFIITEWTISAEVVIFISRLPFLFLSHKY